MKSGEKLFFILFSFLVIVISLFLFFNQYRFEKLESIRDDIKDIKDSIFNVWNSGGDSVNHLSSLQDGVSELGQVVKNQIQGEEEQELEQIIENKIIQELSNLKTEYNHEPWGVKFFYFNDAQKYFDDKNKKISIQYDEDNFLEIKRNILKEKEFKDWLVKNFDIQKLDKENINDLVFWSHEKISTNKLDKNYYISIDRNIFHLNLQCLIDSLYCSKLEQIVKTFKKI